MLKSCTKDANRYIHACQAPVTVRRACTYTQMTRTIREGTITPTVGLSVNIVSCSRVPDEYPEIYIYRYMGLTLPVV